MRDPLGRAGRHPAYLVPVILVLAMIGACSGGKPASAPAEDMLRSEVELPRLALVGGAQDVWPFEFGINASRAGVDASLGHPAGTEVTSAGAESTAMVETWTYPGTELTFFVDDETNTDQLLSARITGAGIELRGGLRLGMPETEAAALLGAPSVRQGDAMVYFYYATTIELRITSGAVAEVTLSRAMP